MKHGHLGISFYLRSLMGQYPSLYYPIYNLIPKNSKLAVKRDTHIVIEGFPRCANTFAVLAFRLAQGPIDNRAHLRIAHHMHVPAQILRAVRLKIPALVLIRDPKEAVISFVIRDPRVSIESALKSYISFYKTILQYRSSYVVGFFEDVVNDFASVIEKVNLKFGTNFTPLTPQGAGLEEIFRRVENQEGGDEAKVSRPSESRKIQKQQLTQEIYSDKYRKLLGEAELIYQRYQEGQDNGLEA